MDANNWTDARSPETTPERLRELYHSDRNVHCHLGGNPNTPADVLQLLARDDEEAVRFFVAGNPSAPADVLEILAHDDAKYAGRYVRSNVGLNPHAPISILKLLAQDIEDVRARTAENPNLPIELLRTLAQDESPIVRCGVARNLNAPVELLNRLSLDEFKYVRRCVAANPSTSADILEHLSHDRWYLIRTAVAENPKTSANTITWLFSHVSEFRFLAKKDMENNALYFDPEIYEEVYENFLLAIAGNPNTPLHILRTLNSKLPSTFILGKALRNCIARNPAWNES